jgi:hypothetical protein
MGEILSADVLDLVSIPCWVSLPSRRKANTVIRRGQLGFNPVLGFSSVATILPDFFL